LPVRICLIWNIGQFYSAERGCHEPDVCRASPLFARCARPCYGPSSARDLKVLAGNCLPFAARTAFSSTLKPRPGPSGSAMYPSPGRSTLEHMRWPSSWNGKKYSVMINLGIHGEGGGGGEGAMVVDLKLCGKRAMPSVSPAAATYMSSRIPPQFETS